MKLYNPTLATSYFACPSEEHFFKVKGNPESI